MRDYHSHSRMPHAQRPSLITPILNSTKFSSTPDSIIVSSILGFVPLHPATYTFASYLLCHLNQTQTNQAVFKLQSAIGDLFRDYLVGTGFIEIHSPKLGGAASESGASVFKVSYFKGNTRSHPTALLKLMTSFSLSSGSAYLAQSPQLAKQMAIAADFERVYEIGPVFRAENANTHRHLTEFIGLDLEMTIEEHYHEVMELLDGMFLSIFRGLREKYKKEIDVVGRQFPADEFKWREGPEGTLKMTFKEATELLVEDGVPREVLDDIKWVISLLLLDIGFG